MQGAVGSKQGPGYDFAPEIEHSIHEEGFGPR